jgi:hypothetical protein
MSRIASKAVPAILLAALALASAAPAFAQKKKPAAPQPKPLTITFLDRAATVDEPGDNVLSDGSPYTATIDQNGKVVTSDGTFINSVGGLELDLAPGGSPARELRFHFPGGIVEADVPAACALPEDMWAAKVDLRFNVVDARGNAVGIEAMGNGTVPATVEGNGAPYGLAGIINFTPDNGSPTLLNVGLMLGGVEGVTLSRTSEFSWIVSSDAPVVVQCLLALSKGRRAVYELGPVPVRFELTAVSGGQ